MSMETPPLQHFGRFTVLAHAGAGAMGVVYGAYDPTLDRRVALKVLRGRGGRERERARREALALARVSHPNVVAIYEVGEEDGRLFIAMEYVDGLDLNAWLTAAPRSWQEIVTMFAGVGRGLAAAHDQGVVHRDFKPSNVLIGADGRPRVIDFGLARAAEGAEEGEEPSERPDPLAVALTQTGHLVGTPAYMAPELLDGGPSTPASDQFAFCVALFEALYGKPPYPRDSLPVLRHAMARGTIEVPDGPLPAAVIAILRRGLSGAPDARFPSVMALLDALNQAVERPFDASRGLRTRVLMVLCGLIPVLFLGLDTWLNGPPGRPLDILRTEGVLTGALVVMLVAFRRWLASEDLTRRIRNWLLMVVVMRPATMLMGARLDMSVEQIFAADTVMMLALLAFSGAYVGLPVRQGLIAISLALLGIFIWPQHVVVMHHLGMLAAMLGFLRNDWLLKKSLNPGR